MSIIDIHPGLKKRQFARGHAIVMAPVAEFVARAIRRHVQAWLMRRAIASLRSLDDRTLADIGIYRFEIEAVVRREMAQHG
jgi:uncharacterized protein YjiS (DUF1127 family)